jgi:hypothetical protein
VTFLTSLEFVVEKLRRASVKERRRGPSTSRHKPCNAIDLRGASLRACDFFDPLLFSANLTGCFSVFNSQTKTSSCLPRPAVGELVTFQFFFRVFCTPNPMFFFFSTPQQNRHPACPGLPWESL